MRRLYPIVGNDDDMGQALRALKLLAGHGVHLLDPRRWLAVELPGEVTRRPAWPQLEALLRERAGGFALVARMIGMMADANAPAELPRRLRQLSGEGRQVAEGVLGRHLTLLDQEPGTPSPAQLDLLYAALAAALAHSSHEGQVP
jgi:hypothetical protein